MQLRALLTNALDADDLLDDDDDEDEDDTNRKNIPHLSHGYSDGGDDGRFV